MSCDHRSDYIPAPCHNGLVCRGCYLEQNIECELCGYKICSADCQYIHYTIRGYVLACSRCVDRIKWQTTVGYKC
jgi:hypothetical protein